MNSENIKMNPELSLVNIFDRVIAANDKVISSQGLLQMNNVGKNFLLINWSKFSLLKVDRRYKVVLLKYCGDARQIFSIS
jgi:hypothetical protein